jgi:DNA polymerase beta
LIHKYNAYRKAASSIAKVDHKIETIKDIKGLVRILTIQKNEIKSLVFFVFQKEGIGKKIQAKIEQYLSTGKIQKLETNRGDETGAAINQMTRIMGIG